MDRENHHHRSWWSFWESSYRHRPQGIPTVTRSIRETCFRSYAFFSVIPAGCTVVFVSKLQPSRRGSEQSLAVATTLPLYFGKAIYEVHNCARVLPFCRLSSKCTFVAVYGRMEAWDLIVVDEEGSKEGLPNISSLSVLVDEKPIDKPLAAVSAPSQVCLLCLRILR